jgi:predicted permease
MLHRLHAAFSRMTGTFRRRRLESELAEELDEHLGRLAERFVQQGMSPEEARYAARRQFGGVTQLQENLRERRGLPQLEIFWRDVRYALRQLRGAPAFTFAAVLTLAIGIGANTAVFAVVDAVVLRPLPYPDPNRLISVESWETAHGAAHPETLSYPNFFDLRGGNRVFEHLVCYRDDEMSLALPTGAIHVDAEIVSWDLFDLLRVPPELGRGFLPDEEKPGTHVAVLSHELWQTHFAADPGIVGRTVTISGKPFTIVGIAPAGFHFPPDSLSSTKLWTTLAEDGVTSQGHPLATQRGARVLRALGRLKEGVTLEQARAGMDSVAAALALQYPEENRTRASTYLRPELERLIGDARQPMLMLLAAVFLVLLVACANIANLVLARSVERQREMAVRSAIGASRVTMIRQLLTESVTLACIGSLAGIFLAYVCLRLFIPLAADSIPRISQATIDARVLAFSTGLALFTSVLFSLAPAFRVARVELANSLKEGARNVARGPEGLRSALVVAQVTLGLMLVSGAGLLVASFLFLQRRDLGLKADHVLTFSVDLPAQYKVAEQNAFSDEILRRLRVLPGVQSVAAGWPLPLMGHEINVSFFIEGQPMAAPERHRSDMAIVTPGYFRALGIPLLQGRDFTERDNEGGTPVVIVNQAFADEFFPGQNALGKRFESGATSGNKGEQMLEIVGIVGNAKQSALDLTPDTIYYFPYRQMPWFIGSIIVRTSVPPRGVESAARAVLASMDRQVPMYRVRTMEEMSTFAMGQPRFQMLLLSTFAVIAIVLTVLGLYGILAYSVVQRTREIGLRMALGATRAGVLGMVLNRAMQLVALGLLLGVAGAAGESYLLESMLYGVRPNNVLLLALACVLVIFTTLVAAWLPARRAASVDVVRALRTE